MIYPNIDTRFLRNLLIDKLTPNKPLKFVAILVMLLAGAIHYYLRRRQIQSPKYGRQGDVQVL